jgi:hypothetical protein
MPVSCIRNNTDHPLFWYRQSHLLLHDNRVYAVNTTNYLAGLMLDVIASNDIKVELSYPPVPFCPLRYLLRLQCPYIHRQPFPITHNISRALTAQPIAFLPMRYMPGDQEYIPHIAGRSRDFLTPNIKLVRSWMKKIAHDRLCKKRLALVMGLHARLGKECPLMELGADLVWAIVFDFNK